MKIIKNFVTFIFIIIALYCIGFICILYQDAFTNLSLDAKINSFKNTRAMFLLTPLLFWVASRSFLFKHANGPLSSNIHHLFKNIAFPNYFKTDFPFISILAVISSSLIAVYAGGALGPSLHGLAQRSTLAQAREQVADARRFNPKTIMPAYLSTEGLHNVAASYRGQTILSPQELEEILSYLFQPSLAPP